MVHALILDHPLERRLDGSISLVGEFPEFSEKCWRGPIVANAETLSHRGGGAS